MKYKVTNPERMKIILTNIRILRNLKGIKQETMAMELGISKSEYSKLESGQKPNWEKYWDKIGELLGIEPFELAIEDCLVKTQNGNIKGNGFLKKASNDEVINERIYKVLEERDKVKDELIGKYRDDMNNWKVKYYRMKSLYLSAKAFIKSFNGKNLNHVEKDDIETAQSIGSVGGGQLVMINIVF